MKCYVWMGIAVVSCAMVAVIFFAAVRLDDTTVRKLEEERRVADLQKTADNVIRGTQYIVDPRTNLCFAYYWGGMANGGPALALIPIESVPPDLLTTAIIEPVEKE